MDFKYASSLGYRIKLLATAKLVDGRLEMHVQPTLIHRENPIAQTEGPFNIVGAGRGQPRRPDRVLRRGAGQLPTASSVLADLVDVAVGRGAVDLPRLELWHDAPQFPSQPIDEIRRRYYLRFLVLDKPHVMADITDILGRNQISLALRDPARIAGSRGNGGPPTVPLIIMTHRCREGQLRRAGEELRKLSCLLGEWKCLAVSDRVVSSGPLRAVPFRKRPGRRSPETAAILRVCGLPPLHYPVEPTRHAGTVGCAPC